MKITVDVRLEKEDRVTVAQIEEMFEGLADTVRIEHATSTPSHSARSHITTPPSSAQSGPPENTVATALPPPAITAATVNAPSHIVQGLAAIVTARDQPAAVDFLEHIYAQNSEHAVEAAFCALGEEEDRVFVLQVVVQLDPAINSVFRNLVVCRCITELTDPVNDTMPQIPPESPNSSAFAVTRVTNGATYNTHQSRRTTVTPAVRQTAAIMVDLVRYQMLPVEAILASATRLVKSDPHRRNGIALLTQMAQRVAAQAQKADTAMLDALRTTLIQIPMSIETAYDVEYIATALNWTQRAQTPILSRRRIHPSSCPAVALIAKPDQVVSCLLDGTVCIWTRQGDPVTEFVLPQQYIGTVDMPDHGLVLAMTALPRANSASCQVQVRTDDGSGSWSTHTAFDCECPVTGVKFLRSVSRVAVAEWRPKAAVSIRDLTRYEDVLAEYVPHSDICTGLKFTDRDVLISSSRDGSLALFDMRTSQAVATSRHQSGILTIDWDGEQLVSGGSDGNVFVTDLRMFQAQPVIKLQLESSIVSVAARGHICAISSQSSVVLTNISGTVPPPLYHVEGYEGTCFNALAWEGSQLFGVSDTTKLEILTLPSSNADE